MSLGSTSRSSPRPGATPLLSPGLSSTPGDMTPKGGILRNSRRSSDSPISRTIPLPTLSISLPGLNKSSGSDIGSPQTPLSPVGDPMVYGSGPFSPSLTSPSVDPSASPNQPRIRFAPLPDPRRPRSLSTGRNIAWTPSEGPNGETKRTIELRGVNPTVEYDDDSDMADEDEDGFDGVDGVDGVDEDGKRGRRWSKSMSMGSWSKGTKKLLGMKTEGEAYSEGAPLKKSISTGGFIGASPFRYTVETERRRSMLGTSPAPDHRRNASMEQSGSSSVLSSSPQPVRMLNGRVYGSRRAVEAAEREKAQREAMEPAFIEWGHGKQGAGLGSNNPSTAKSGFLDDAEEGSGMEWVKRRRAERQRREAEQREKEKAEGLGLSSSLDPSLSGQRHERQSGESERSSLDRPPLTTSLSEPGRSAPVIQVSQHVSPVNRGSGPTSSTKPIPLVFSQDTNRDRNVSSGRRSPTESSSDDHHSRAMQIPARKVPRNGDSGDMSEDDDVGRRSMESGRKEDDPRSSSDMADRYQDEVIEEDSSEEEDREDDTDDDDDEEEPNSTVRTTSSAAGIEVVSRHKS